jgi:uncharacterized protein
MEPARILVRLQEHDLKLMRLSRQLEEMPEKRAILQARQKLVEIRNLKERTAAAVRAIDSNMKQFEDDIQMTAGKIDTEQAKLLSGAIKIPKELQAISFELDSLKRRLDQLENELLAQMQKRETAMAQVEKVDAAVEAGERTEALLTERFRTRGGDILAQLDAGNTAREALMAQLPADLRDRYESLRTLKNGIAVGVLQSGMCSACRVGLPSGRVQTLLDGPDVAACPSCNRILVVRDGSDDAPR